MTYQKYSFIIFPVEIFWLEAAAQITMGSLKIGENKGASFSSPTATGAKMRVYIYFYTLYIFFERIVLIGGKKMKNFKKILAVLLTVLMLLGSFGLTSFAASTKDRYSVLVLDVSGSMSGKPIAELKKAATAFCQKVLRSNRSSNKVAIVTFASSTNLLSDFTSDLDTLLTAIDNISASGNTYIAGGLSKAQEIMNNVEGDVIKDIVVMSDGMPFDEQSAFNVVESLSLSVNIYGVYLYTSGFDSSAEEVMKKIGRNDYAGVSNASELTFEFIEDANTINTKSATNVTLYIACPVDVSVTLNGDTLDKYNTKTTFGTLEFEGENDEIKVLKLSYRDDYVINIFGTGDGTMDYKAEYYCNDDLLYTSSYPTVDITPTTIITTGVDVDNSRMTLDIDTDGDGTVDKTVSPNVSSSSIWYRIKTFFEDMFYKIKEFFAGIFSF